MAAYQLPVMESIREAWGSVKGAKKPFWGAYGWISIIAIVVGVATAVLNAINSEGTKALAGIINGIFPIISSLLAVGITRMGIYRALNRPITASIAFYPVTNLTLILKLTGLWLLEAIILFPFIALVFFVIFFEAQNKMPPVGLDYALYVAAALAIVAGIYVMIRVRLSWGFMLDREVNPWQALVLSFYATRDNFWCLIGFYIVSTLILIASTIPLGIGLIWSIPFIQIAYGVVYRRLMQGQGA